VKVLRSLEASKCSQRVITPAFGGQGSFRRAATFTSGPG
jgi:hypothetical protein